MLGVMACHLICDNPETPSSSPCSVHATLQPIPDPGPGRKGFDPWNGNESVKLAVNDNKQPNEDGRDSPTLAFPTVMPPPLRGNLIEVGVEFPDMDRTNTN